MLPDGQTPYIGTSIAHTQVYVLDPRLQLVPIGVPGELYISGLGLARGYLNLPQVTAERFVPHPFSEQRGAWLYRTGDRVRYRSDGRLEYLGGLDQQVKLRGYRIELGEIGTVLSIHPMVRECVVLLREDEPGVKRLVAYVVSTDPDAIPGWTEVRACLQTHLPEYMVPSHLVVVASLPLLPGGKIDRRALPSPEGRSVE